MTNATEALAEIRAMGRKVTKGRYSAVISGWTTPMS